MVRYYQRRYYRPRTYRPRFRKGTMFAKRGPRVRGLRGRRTRQYLKSKKFQIFKTYDNIKPAYNIDEVNTAGLLVGRVDAIRPITAGIQVINHDPDAREVWHGVAYAAANQAALLAAGNALDADNNPIQNGDGLLDLIHRRDGSMDHTKYYYSAYRIAQGDLIRMWNAVNRQIAIHQVYIKAFKVSVRHRSAANEGLCFLAYRKWNGGTADIKIREGINKVKGYFKTVKRSDPNALGQLWDMPAVWVAGYAHARVMIKLYFKIKNIAFL